MTSSALKILLERIRRKRISEARLGKTFSAETKQKMSQAKLGKPHPYMQGDKHPNYGGRHSVTAWKTRRERYGPTGMKPKEE